MKIIKHKLDNPNTFHNDDISSAIKDINDGKLVVYPTETVYGIGSSIYNQTAVRNIYIVKHRPFDMPLSITVSDKTMLEKVAILNEEEQKLVKELLPGPLTIIMEKQTDVPNIVTSNLQQVGIRMPNNIIALELARHAGPITSTSANIHTHPNAKDVNDAINDLGNSIDTYIDGGPCAIGSPSTVVSIINKKIKIIRNGSISIDRIKEVLKC